MAFLNFDRKLLEDEPQLISTGECSFIIKGYKETLEGDKYWQGYDEVIIFMYATDRYGKSSRVPIKFGNPEFTWRLSAFCKSIGLHAALKQGWIDYSYLIGRTGKFINEYSRDGQYNQAKSFLPAEKQFTQAELESLIASSKKPYGQAGTDDDDSEVPF